MSQFDTVWEKEIYGQGRHLNRYPFDSVVSFVYRYAPRELQREHCRILEVGCGAGNNLWFAAREGFSVYGVDASGSAIDYAQTRFDQEGLKGTFVQGRFDVLPFEADFFDLVIDREALACVGLSVAKNAIGHIHRVLKPKGKFYFNPYSSAHSSCQGGQLNDDNLTLNIASGSIQGVGQICFYNRQQLEEVLVDPWQIIEGHHLRKDSILDDSENVHAEWHLVLEKQ